jgi:hypothetical protein
VSYRERFESAGSETNRQAVCAEYARSLLKEPGEVSCRAEDLPDISLFERFDRAITWRIPVQVGGRGKVGYKKFEWADATSAEAQKASEKPWEVSLAANVLLPYNVVVGAEYRHQVGFEEEKKRTVCLPLSTAPGASTCRELPFGAYKSKDREVATAVVRKWIRTFAMDLRVSYDFDNDAKSVEIPLQFVSLEGKGVTAGVAAGWSSEPGAEHNGWSVRAFVGDVLSVWPTKR